VLEPVGNSKKSELAAVNKLSEFVVPFVFTVLACTSISKKSPGATVPENTRPAPTDAATVPFLTNGFVMPP
jgi:hypothetical protein